MPSDEMVEKVARAIYEARDAHEPPRAWRKWEDIGDEARAVWCQCATVALSAAHAEPVWVVVKQFHGEVSTYDVGSFVRVTSIYNGNATIEPVAGRGCVVGVPLDRLKRTSLYASPSEAAIRADERAAIRKGAFEEAAKVADGYDHDDPLSDYDAGWNGAAQSIATAIRAKI